MTRTRLVAAAAALIMAGGAGTMLVALVAAPGPWWQGYVSEAGTAGQPFAGPYRWGLLLLALGVAVLGRARLPERPRPAAWPGRLRDGTVAALCLVGAALLAGASAVVPCSDRCPLPPYEPATAADVVHAGASILGMVVLAGAMAATWFAGQGPARAAAGRLAAGAVSLTVPLGAALGLTMLITGRGTLGAVLERSVLLVAVAWLVATALLTAVGRGEVRKPV